METETNLIKETIRIADTTANPAPLGLLAFGMTTILLNLHNAGFFAMGSAIFAMGIFFGGIAQIIAGIMEWKKNNTFGSTAFVSYGFFWISLVGLILIPVFGWSSSDPDASTCIIPYTLGIILVCDVHHHITVVKSAPSGFWIPDAAVSAPDCGKRCW